MDSNYTVVAQISVDGVATKLSINVYAVDKSHALQKLHRFIAYAYNRGEIVKVGKTKIYSI